MKAYRFAFLVETGGCLEDLLRAALCEAGSHRVPAVQVWVRLGPLALDLAHSILQAPTLQAYAQHRQSLPL